MTAADCIPSHQWLTEFLADFAGLRSQLHREEEDIDPFLPTPPPPPPPHPLPHFRDKNGWQRYCLGAAFSQHYQASALQATEPDAFISNGAPESPADAMTEVPAEATVVNEDSLAHATHDISEATTLTAGSTSQTAANNRPVTPEMADLVASSATDQGANGAIESVPAASQSMSDAEMTSAVGHPPQMAVLASLDQVLTNYLLQWHVNWAMVTPDITDLSMRWLYALLAQIQKPVALESSSQLSKLLRHCIKVRGQITDSNDVRLLSLHMLTALAGGYFGQDRALAACMQSGWV